MAVSSGSEISISNYTGTYTGSWRSTPNIHNKYGSGSSSGTIYFCAPSCVAILKCATAWAGARVNISWTCYYWNGSSWVKKGDGSDYAKGIDSSGKLKLVHNQNETGSIEDVSNNHWWRIDWSRSTSGTFVDAGGNYSDLTLYLGGIEIPYVSSSGSATYEFLWKRGNKIYACPVTYSTTESDITNKYYTNYTGTKISVSGGTAGYIYGRG